jgi:cytochrome c-type biogenesis protein CcmH/NrfG
MKWKSITREELGRRPEFSPDDVYEDWEFNCQNRFEKIMSLFVLGFTYEAGNKLEQHIMACPDYKDNEIWHEFMGDINVKKGEIQNAIDSYMISLMIKPDYNKVRLKLAKLYETKNELVTAEKEYLRILDSDAHNLDALLLLAKLYLTQKKFKQATQKFEILKEISSKLNPKYASLAKKEMEKLNNIVSID